MLLSIIQTNSSDKEKKQETRIQYEGNKFNKVFLDIHSEQKTLHFIDFIFVYQLLNLSHIKLS